TRDNPRSSISQGPPHKPRTPRTTAKDVQARTIGARNSREKPSLMTSRASSFRLRRVVTSGGVSRTTKAT
ncbi:MAG: hypothetical protein ACK56F_01880, partial [bacterium]